MIESSPGVREGSSRLWVGEEELQGATPGGKLLSALEGPEYSIFCIFTLGHLLELGSVADILSIVQGAKAARDSDEKRGASQNMGRVCRSKHRKNAVSESREVKYKANEHA